MQFLMSRLQASAISDHRDQHVAGQYALFDCFYEVDPRVDVIDIHEDLIRREVFAVKNGPRQAVPILPAVALSKRR